MRLLCPHCQRAISIPDSEAGKAVACTLCHQLFAAPEITTITPSSIPLPPPTAPTPPVYTPGHLQAQASALASAPIPFETTNISNPVSVFSTTPVNIVPINKIPNEPNFNLPSPPLNSPDPSRQSTPSVASIPSNASMSLSAPEMELSGYRRMSAVTLYPKFFSWLAPIGMTLALILTFFPWSGMYPGGYGAYTQNAWESLFGGVSKNAVAEDELKMETQLRERLRTCWWLLPYFIVLFPALFVSWSTRLWSYLQRIYFGKLPNWIVLVSKYRPAALIGATSIAFLLLFLQTRTGFGLEKSLTKSLEENYAKQKEAANTPEKMQRLEMQMSMDLGKYHLDTTFWLSLAVLAHLMAVIGAAGEVVLHMRGNQPPPRVGIVY